MSDAFAATLRQAWMRALVRWPDIGLDEDEYLSYARGSDQVATPAGLEDLVLALACLRQYNAALRHFERDVISGIGPAIARIEVRPDAVDEVKQQLRTRLFTGPDAKIADYRGSGPLAAWVNVSAIRTALNLRRADRRAERHTTGADLDDPLADLVLAVDTLDVELELLKARFRGAFSGAVRAACRDLGDRDRALLKMQLLDGHGIDVIARLYGVHRSTAARWRHRAREALQHGARARLQAKLSLDTREAKMVERLLHTQLSVSFSGLADEPVTG